MKEARQRRDRWEARPVAAFVLRTVILSVPVGVSLLVTLMVRDALPPAQGVATRLTQVVVLLSVALLVAFLVERFARRLLPLATMLKMSMLFPDRAPSRFAVALEAGSLRRLRAHLEELEASPSAVDESLAAGSILALATAMQMHDRRTRGHAERVRVFTDMLGEELGLSGDDRYRLRWAALLHDIGKLAINPHILNKPSGLTLREWKVMRRHPLEGVRIAEPLMEWLGPWSGAIAEHHERMDGRGYPEGLTGDAISLSARIVAVTDAYDTMTAVRSYRQPVAARAAREELAACAGSQFDIDVVRGFLAISLPRLLWKTGPASLIVQLPFLRTLREAGRQTLAAGGQGVAVAAIAGVAGVAVMTVAASGQPASQGQAGQGHRASQSAIAQPSLPTATAQSRSLSGAARRSQAKRRGPEGGQGGPGGNGGSLSAPTPAAAPGASPQPSQGSAGTSPISLPLPLPSLPVPTPSVSLPPLPTPKVSVPPLPTPKVSVPPLPTPSVSLPALPAPKVSLPGSKSTGSK